MNSIFGRWLLLSPLVLGAGLVHAEGGCPPGYQPTGMAPSARAPVACRPIDGYNQQGPQAPQVLPPMWINQWGAIATDFPHSAAGASVNRTSRTSAEHAAIVNCQSNGGVQCKVEIAYYNQCAALVVGRTGHNSGSAPTIAQAVQTGIKVCTDAGDTECRAYYTACSLPVGVQ